MAEFGWNIIFGVGGAIFLSYPCYVSGDLHLPAFKTTSLSGEKRRLHFGNSVNQTIINTWLTTSIFFNA